MIVSLLCLPKNLALSNLALTGFHSISDLSIPFLRISVTPTMWRLSSLPEKDCLSCRCDESAKTCLSGLTNPKNV